MNRNTCTRTTATYAHTPIDTTSGVTTEDATPVFRNYKDTVFRMLFNSPDELLGLFNAVNETTYKDASELEIFTLENAVYMNVKNDVSCILDMHLQLYEHQSTANLNMPLRALAYVAKQIEKLIIKKDLYSSKRIMLPAPKFFVFYNGIEEQPERELLRLSDAFAIKETDPALELKVLQLNINDGYNEKLKQDCPTLMEYMIYVNKIRKYRQTLSLNNAVNKAVDECIKEGILKEFLIESKAEVIAMSIFEYDEELHKKTLLAEGYEDGVQDGETLNIITLIAKKIISGKPLETIAEELETDSAAIEPIYHIITSAKEPLTNQQVLEKMKEMKR